MSNWMDYERDGESLQRGDVVQIVQWNPEGRMAGHHGALAIVIGDAKNDPYGYTIAIVRANGTPDFFEVTVEDSERFHPIGVASIVPASDEEAES